MFSIESKVPWEKLSDQISLNILGAIFPTLRFLRKFLSKLLQFYFSHNHRNLFQNNFTDKSILSIIPIIVGKL